MSKRNRPITKDMYWFAHGGSEAMANKNEEENEHLDRKGTNEEPKSTKDISLTDGSNSSGPPSLERDDRLHPADRRLAVEERRKLLWEAEQERNDAVMRKHMERGAALEARRNAQRSTISFAFGSSVPRNVDTLQPHHSVEVDCMSRSFTAASSSHRAELENDRYDRRSISPNYSGVNGTSHQPDSFSERVSKSGCLVGSGAFIVEDLMSRSMTASAPRGRRKNDLMPTVPYDRTAAPRVTASSSASRRRSVSMTRLDQLAQPKKHYVEATKANASGLLKNGSSPNRPLSSASEHSGGRAAASSVTRRVRSSPRKPRPVSIAGTVPDHRQKVEVKGGAMKKTPAKKIDHIEVKKAPSPVKSTTTKLTEKPKTPSRPATAPVKAPKTVAAKPRTPLAKDKNNSTPGSAKAQHTNKPANKKKTEVQVSSAKSDDVKVDRTEKSESPQPDSDSGVDSDKNNKRIISEEEARAALAEKRRIAREQAEREAELERQRQEDLRMQEEERLQREEEEQRKMEEESMRLLEEHRRQEEEKLRRAIEDLELKKEEERTRQEEESRLKAEQDRKAKEESEKIRLEMEEKVRREEEERAERKKRLEKIMSRTRGKSSGLSPSGSVSGSDQMDSGENQPESYSSGANSLESNEGANSPTSEDAMSKMEVSSASVGNSLEANLTYEFSSNDVSLNSNDLMLPQSAVSSQDNSMVVDKEISAESTSAVTPVNISGVLDLTDARESDEKLNLETNAAQSEDPTENSAINENIEADYIGVDQKLPEKENGPNEDEFKKAQSEISELQSTGGQVDQNEKVSQFIEESVFDAHSSKYSTDLYLNNELQENAFGNENFESTVSQSIPSDHLKEESSKDQDLEKSALESNYDQTFDLNQDPITDVKHEQDFIEQAFGENITVSSEESKFVEEVPELGTEILNLAESSKEDKQMKILEGNTCANSWDKENNSEMGETAQNKLLHSADLLSHDAFGVADNPFGGAGDASESSKTTNLDNPFALHFTGGGDVSQAFNSEEIAASVNMSVDNPFTSNHISNETEQNVLNSQLSDYDLEASKLLGHADLSDNVTLIKQEGGEKYVGIISSIDNDHLSNNFPSKLNEHLINNLECASTTDDSSLDSNLSQVMAPEEEETDHHQSSIPPSGINYYSEFEVYSNGHSVDPSTKKVADYGILSVEDNIFENAVNEKISSDPFLSKGSSHQISGNPFLVQEEQVLVASDFLN